MFVWKEPKINEKEAGMANLKKPFAESKMLCSLERGSFN